MTSVLLVSTYELGRQPFGVASPAAWLREEGADVSVLDLSRQAFDAESFRGADLIAFYVPMHTATRIAARLIARVRAVNPTAHLCFYGLYAPVNEGYLRQLGAGTILGGEFEEGLVSLVRRLHVQQEGGGRLPRAPQPEPLVSLARLQFKVPDRGGLPGLESYARLMVGGESRVVGYTEASRGCKHVCRHCPIVPVYEGNFRIVQREVVIEDVRRQIEAGAQHITFGDPDFWNGPTHAVHIVTELHRRFPALTYDVTIKIEHLVKHAELLPTLRDTGCLFVTSAVESIEPEILEAFDKCHTREEFRQVVHAFRELGLTFNPTFVTFTPWTTLVNYLDLLRELADLDLVDAVPPIQYAIRLLIPAGSKLLDLAEVRELVGDFDAAGLSHPWVHPDPMVDELHQDVLAAVQAAQAAGASRREVFARVWRLASGHLERATMAKLGSAGTTGEGTVAAGKTVAAGTMFPGKEVPRLTENWFC